MTNISIKPSIIFVLFDSMRARNVSCYGYHRPTTPNLDRLASEGVRFADAFAQAPFTVASITSILSGVYPSIHRLRHHGQRLASGLTTLPEVLQTAGYYTAGFVANPHISPASGLTRGFDYFSDGRPRFKQLPGVKRLAAWAESGKALNREVKKQLKKVQSQPFFFFVFYNDSHVPFSDLPRVFLPLIGRKFHTPAFEHFSYSDEELARVKDLYDQALRRADQRFGELFGLIQNLQLTENTIFVVSADHGEGLDRRIERAGHGRLYENGIHIPLVVWASRMDRPGGVVDELVSSLDIAPTICEWARVETPNHWQGDSMSSYLKGSQSGASNRYIISEHHDSRCIRTGQWKLIHRGAGIGEFRSPEEAAVELYNLEHDPGEEQDLSQEHPDVVSKLSHILFQFSTNLAQFHFDPGKYEMDEILIERLRGLGYLA